MKLRSDRVKATSKDPASPKSADITPGRTSDSSSSLHSQSRSNSSSATDSVTASSRKRPADAISNPTSKKYFVNIDYGYYSSSVPTEDYDWVNLQHERVITASEAYDISHKVIREISAKKDLNIDEIIQIQEFELLESGTEMRDEVTLDDHTYEQKSEIMKSIAIPFVAKLKKRITDYRSWFLDNRVNMLDGFDTVEEANEVARGEFESYWEDEEQVPLSVGRDSGKSMEDFVTKSENGDKWELDDDWSCFGSGAFGSTHVRVWVEQREIPALSGKRKKIKK